MFARGTKRDILRAVSIRLASALLACFVAVAPGSESEVEPPADPTAEEVRNLFYEADAHYQTSAYGEAVESFTEAFNLSRDIQDDALREAVRTSILFNLARAHFKAYGVDVDAAHLRKAKELLENYMAGTDLEDEAEAQELLADIEAKLAELDEGGPASEPVPKDTGPKRKNSGLTIAGYVTTGLGVAAIALPVTGSVLVGQAEDDYLAGPSAQDRADAESRGQTGDNLIVAGSVVAGVLVAAGVTMIVLGKRKDKKEMALAPVVGESFAGVSWAGRF